MPIFIRQKFCLIKAQIFKIALGVAETKGRAGPAGHCFGRGTNMEPEPMPEQIEMTKAEPRSLPEQIFILQKIVLKLINKHTNLMFSLLEMIIRFPR